MIDPGEHVGLVYSTVIRMQYGRGRAALDDLVGAGMIGLVEAAARFDEARGFRFSTFAVPRIRGAVREELRRMQRERWIVQRVDGVRTRIAPIVFVGLQTENKGPRNAVYAPQLVDECERADAIQEREQIARLVRAAVDRLPEKERAIVAARFFREEMLEAIARRHGVSPARISQILTRAIERLRPILAEAVGLPAPPTPQPKPVETAGALRTQLAALRRSRTWSPELIARIRKVERRLRALSSRAA